MSEPMPMILMLMKMREKQGQPKTLSPTEHKQCPMLFPNQLSWGTLDGLRWTNSYSPLGLVWPGKLKKLISCACSMTNKTGHG